MSCMVQAGAAVLWEPDKKQAGGEGSGGLSGCVALTSGVSGGPGPPAPPPGPPAPPRAPHIRTIVSGTRRLVPLSDCR